MRVPPLALFLLFTLVPLLEVWLLIELGRWIGFWPTLAIVIGTGFIGASLARREGARVLTQWHEATSRGQLPKEGLASGLLVLLGGILLITPGVLTDLAGLLLLFPPTRRLVAGRVQRRLEQRFTLGGPGLASSFGGVTVTGFSAEVGREHRERQFIDVEATFVEQQQEDESPSDEAGGRRGDATARHVARPDGEPSSSRTRTMTTAAGGGRYPRDVSDAANLDREVEITSIEHADPDLKVR